MWHPGFWGWRKSHLFWDMYNIYLFRSRTSPSKKVGNVDINRQNCYSEIKTHFFSLNLTLMWRPTKLLKFGLSKAPLGIFYCTSFEHLFGPFKNARLKIPAGGQHVAMLFSGLTFNTTLTSHFAFFQAWLSGFSSESYVPFNPHAVDYLI